MRLHKFLADAGVFSRREAERAIASGIVQVNGAVVRDPASIRVAPTDVVSVRGRRVRAAAEPTRVWLHYKMRGLLCTETDPAGRPCLLPHLAKRLNRNRVLCVGRLDFDSEGLLLLTNDGELKRHLELPSSGFARTYLARVFPAARLTADVIDALAAGGVLDFGPIEVVPSVERDLQREHDAPAQWFDVTLREGKNREIRRAFEHFDIVTQRLIRTAFGPFRLARLRPDELVEAPQHVVARLLPEQLAADRQH